MEGQSGVRSVWRRPLLWALALWLGPLGTLAGVMAWSVWRERSFQPARYPLPKPNGWDRLAAALDSAAAREKGPPPKYAEQLLRNADILPAVDAALALPIEAPLDPSAPQVLSAVTLRLREQAVALERGRQSGLAADVNMRQVRLGLALSQGRNFELVGRGLALAAMAIDELPAGSPDADRRLRWLVESLAKQPSPRAVWERCAPYMAVGSMASARWQYQIWGFLGPSPSERYRGQLAGLRRVGEHLDQPPTRWPRTAPAPSMESLLAMQARGYLGDLARVRVALAGLALRAYDSQQKRWPDKLAALVPRYLGAVPIDPCTGEALHYRLVDGQPRCWSVGGDLRDDGGEPPDLTSPEPAGDIVWPEPKRPN